MIFAKLPNLDITNRSFNTLKAFTIIELLIVIVIVGVLVAVSAVSYAGLTKGAKEASAQSAAKQVSTKVTMSYTQTGSFPATLSSIGITDSGDTTYQYSSTSNTWCSTVTTSTSSYYVSNTTSTPISGGCPGHGQQGMAPITNIAPNPGAENNIGWYSNHSINYPRVFDTTKARTGNYSVSAANIASSTTLLSLYGVGGLDGSGFDVEENTTYTVSIYFTADVPHQSIIGCGFRAGGSYGSTTYSSYAVGTPGSWTRVVYTCNSPSGADKLRVIPVVSSLTTQPAGTRAYVDDFMAVTGTTAPVYADGSSLNWIWNGVANASTSTGPAL